jgi:hypothetical protein
LVRLSALLGCVLGGVCTDDPFGSTVTWFIHTGITFMSEPCYRGT